MYEVITLHETDLVDDSTGSMEIRLLRRRPCLDRGLCGDLGFRWAYADDKLTLSDITGGTWEDAEVWTIKPTNEIGDRDPVRWG